MNKNLEISLGKIKNKPSKIINNKNSKESIIIQKHSTNIQLDFRYFIYEPFKYKNFTNFVKTEDSYKKTINALYRKFIPYCDNKNISEIQRENEHNHYLKDEVAIRVNEIIKECVRRELCNINIENIDEGSYYQLYSVGGMRIICYLNGITFYLLFVDPHHLVDPDEKFNEDYDNYTYQPKLISEEKVVIFDEVEIEHCYDCEHMKKYLES